MTAPLRAAGAALLAAAMAGAGDTAPAPLASVPARVGHRAGQAEALLDEGERLWTAGLYARAEAVLEEALALARRSEDLRLEARALNLLADVGHSQGDPTPALERHERALALARETADGPLEARILRDMGVGHWRRAEYGEAAARCQEALAASERLRDASGEVRARRCLGAILYKQDRYEGALAEYSRALGVATESGDVQEQALAQEDLANAHRDRLAYTRALDHFQRSLALMERAGDGAGRCRVLGLLGHLHLILGDDAEAARYFERALQVAREAKDPAGEASALSKLGGVHARRGQAERALEYYASSLRIRREIADPREQGWTLARMGAVHAAEGRLDDALRHYQEALALWEQIRDGRAPAWHLLAVARIHERRGAEADALAFYERALRLGEEIQLPLVSVALGDMGRLHARHGRREQALEHGRRALAVAEASGNRDLLWRALHDLARIRLAAGGDDEQALNDLHRSIAVLDELRADVIPTEEARAGWHQERQEVYGTAVGALMARGRVEEALQVAERGRGRAFLDMVAGRATGASPDLEALREQARRRATTLVEYFADAEHLFIWVVSPTGEVHGASSPAGPDEVAGLIAELRRRLRADTATREDQLGEDSPDDETARSGDGPAARREPADARPLLRALHTALVKPVEQWLPADPRQLVTFVPSGKLFLLSFAALVDGRGRYLVERHTLSYAPAIAVLQFTGRPLREPGRGLMVVGNPAMPTLPGRRSPLRPLPAAEDEARAIGRLFPRGPVTLLLGARAAERTVRQEAPRHGVLHLATHGIVRDDAPMESLLALAPSAKEAADGDGLWTAREVLGLDLPADLVTLSACSTGLGRVTGDGVLGLSRAFLHAGTASLVVSLWRVADPVARHQMETFYRELGRAPKSKARALRRAQLDTIRALREGRLVLPSGRALPEDPAYWAPFVLIGEPN